MDIAVNAMLNIHELQICNPKQYIWNTIKHQNQQDSTLLAKLHAWIFLIFPN
jgi:hypothetical protein